MGREAIDQIPLYPEERLYRRPPTERVLEVFSHTQRIVVQDGDTVIQAVEPDLTELQTTPLRLLGVRTHPYGSRA